MKILLSDQVKELDKYTIDNEPVHPISLMERAARVCADWIIPKFDIGDDFKVFSGPGNNGGDGLAIARLLADAGYYVEVFIIGKLSDLAEINHHRLMEQNKAKVFTLKTEDTFPVIDRRDIIIDCLFGSGLNRPLEGIYAKLVNHLNDSSASIISIDIPSGLLAEDNSKQQRISKDKKGAYTYENVIKAKYTLTLEMPFLSFFFADVSPHVGEWHILPIGLHKGYLESVRANNFYVTKQLIKEQLFERHKFSHKGNYGHALLISGSYGKMGAPVLASRACLRAGVGLLTTHVPRLGYQIIQTAVPENMTSIDNSEYIFTIVPEDVSKYDTLAIGPGIGTEKETVNALNQLLDNFHKPIIFDADAINILAANKELLEKVPENSIFTPHPKELERLIGKTDNYYERNQLQIEFSKKYSSVVLLKGAYSSIICPDGSCYFNSTGNPGMATAGTGDVLTGIILGLLSQGYDSKWATLIGVYLHGLSGDIAVEKFGEDSLISSDIIDQLGQAFLNTRH